MTHGGARPNAGRKPGSLTQKTREIAEKAAEGGVTPLEFMLSVLRDDKQPPAMRFEAAKAAAPFVHPKLSSIEAKVDADLNFNVEAVEFIVVDPASSPSS